VDEIEWGTEDSFCFYVVHFKLDVWWDPETGQISVFISGGIEVAKPGLVYIIFQKSADCRDGLSAWRWRKLDRKCLVRAVEISALARPIAICGGKPKGFHATEDMPFSSQCINDSHPPDKATPDTP
jgi:hypothetical protein